MCVLVGIYRFVQANRHRDYRHTTQQRDKTMIVRLQKKQNKTYFLLYLPLVQLVLDQPV